MMHKLDSKGWNVDQNGASTCIHKTNAAQDWIPLLQRRRSSTYKCIHRIVWKHMHMNIHV
jgi:hypothetical protein